MKSHRTADTERRPLDVPSRTWSRSIAYILAHRDDRWSRVWRHLIVTQRMTTLLPHHRTHITGRCKKFNSVDTREAIA